MLSKQSMLTGLCGICLLHLAGCATHSDRVEGRKKMYETSARVHDTFAQDWQTSGNAAMADYHRQAADRARHNRHAADCGLVNGFLFSILLGSDACETR